MQTSPDGGVYAARGPDHDLGETSRGHAPEYAHLARRLGVSKMTIQRIWKAHGLQPHRVKRFKLSRDPHFVEKLRDVVGLYLNPPRTVPCLRPRNPESIAQRIPRAAGAARFSGLLPCASGPRESSSGNKTKQVLLLQLLIFLTRSNSSCLQIMPVLRRLDPHWTCFV